MQINKNVSQWKKNKPRFVVKILTTAKQNWMKTRNTETTWQIYHSKEWRSVCNKVNIREVEISTVIHKIVEKSGSFHVGYNSALQEGFNFYFSGVFCSYWQNFNFRGGTKHYAIILWRFEIFLIFSNFLRFKS